MPHNQKEKLTFIYYASTTRIIVLNIRNACEDYQKNCSKNSILIDLIGLTRRSKR